MTKYFQGVIFDLDGTLADTLADIADRVNHVLSGHGFPTHDYDSYRYYVGNGIRNLVIRSLPEQNRDNETVDTCFHQVMADYEQNFISKTKLYDGVPALLDALESQKIRLAVLSNKADPITRKICAVLLEKWKFDIILGASARFPHKPDPASALYVADRMHVDPSHVLYLGDSNVDMQTAVAAGFYPIGVTWGFRPRQELLDGGARATIDHPMDLLSVF